jgi:hypothetical protein
VRPGTPSIWGALAATGRQGVGSGGLTDAPGDRDSRVAARPGLAALLATVALACVHGRRLVENLARTQWEDDLFFRYTREHIHTLVDCFRLPGPYPGLYRPLATNLFYFVGLGAFGRDLAAYHLICLVLAIFNAVLLYRIAFRLLRSGWALLAPVLFVSRLANVEVLTHSCEFQSLFAVFWGLLCIDWFMGGRVRWSAVAFVLALASKETAIVVPAILLAHGVLFDRQRRRRAYLGHLVVAGLWMAALLAFHDRATGFRYDLSPSNVLRNLAAYLLAFCNPLVWPLDDWVMPARVSTIASWRVTQLGIVALLALCLISFARAGQARARPWPWPWPWILGFGFAWFVIATLPAAIFEGRLFMRYGYFGYAGLSIAAAGAGALIGGAIREWRYASGVDRVHEPANAKRP